MIVYSSHRHFRLQHRRSILPSRVRSHPPLLCGQVSFTCNSQKDTSHALSVYADTALSLCSSLSALPSIEPLLIAVCANVTAVQQQESQALKLIAGQSDGCFPRSMSQITDLSQWEYNEKGRYGYETWGCGDLQCAGHRPVIQANVATHRRLELNYTCESEIDYTRGLLTILEGAADVCRNISAAVYGTTNRDILPSASGVINIRPIPSMSGDLLAACSRYTSGGIENAATLRAFLTNRGSAAESAPCVEPQCELEVDLYTGCGDTSCPSSHSLISSNLRSHRELTVPFTCDADVDTAHTLIPWVESSIETCDAWLAAVASPGSIPADSDMIAFCNGRKPSLEWFLAELRQWLVANAVPTPTPCNEGDLMGCGDTKCSVARSMMDQMMNMHRDMAISFEVKPGLAPDSLA